MNDQATYNYRVVRQFSSPVAFGKTGEKRWATFRAIFG